MDPVSTGPAHRSLTRRPKTPTLILIVTLAVFLNFPGCSKVRGASEADTREKVFPAMWVLKGTGSLANNKGDYLVIAVQEGSCETFRPGYAWARESGDTVTVEATITRSVSINPREHVACQAAKKRPQLSMVFLREPLGNRKVTGECQTPAGWRVKDAVAECGKLRLYDFTPLVPTRSQLDRELPDKRSHP